MDPERRSALAQRYRITVIVGVAMIASLFLYALVAEVIQWTQAPFRGFAPFPGWEVLRYVFLGVALVEAFVIRVVRKSILAGVITPEKLHTASVSSYAICEGVGLLGFVLFVIGGRRMDLYLFLVLSLGLFGIYFPRYEQWEELMRGGGRAAN